jgi:butyrate kinase
LPHLHFEVPRWRFAPFSKLLNDALAMQRVLAINPGATSTKFAVFEGESAVVRETLEHRPEDLRPFASVIEQQPFRLACLLSALERSGVPLDSLSAVVARGGLLRPVAGGVYSVNELMVQELREAANGEHASNLGAVLARCLSERLGIPAFVVDPVAVDEMEPEARISGMPELPRVSLSHALNSKAVARKVAAEMGKRYEDVNLIVAHLGSGISVSPHRRGRMIDVNNAQEEGPFAPDRCGGLPAKMLVKLCYSGKYTQKQMLEKIMGSGGMCAYLGTRDIREAEARADAGDELAGAVLNAMAYQVAKEIGAMAAALSGNVDQIVITGGMARSARIVKAITERVAFIAPVTTVPGEEELEALAAGAFRVLRGQEQPQQYQ